MNVASHYRRNAIEGKNNTGLIVLLYDRLVSSLFSGMAAMEAGEIETRTKQMNHAIQILGHLHSTLDFNAGGEIAKSLDKFYSMAMLQILRASALKDVEIIKQLIAQVASVSEAWREVERQERGSKARDKG